MLCRFSLTKDVECIFAKKKKRFFDFILGKGKTEIPTCDRINPELEG